MPTRTLLRLLLLAGLVAPLSAFALGVGPLEVRSALNQNLEAEIPLIVNHPAELTGLTVRIPRQQDFDRLGVERLEFLSKLRFAVQAPPGGPSVIQVTSIEPIREPNFNLLVEVVWPRGRLLREFPVQIDPELYANRRPPATRPAPIAPPPPVAAMPAPAPAPAMALALPPTPPVSFEGASFYGPVRPGETLLAIANRVRPSTAISLPQMMAVLVAGNPDAFANGNPNTLRAGSTLRVPTPQSLGVAGAPAPEPAAAIPAATPESVPTAPGLPPETIAPTVPAPSMPVEPAAPAAIIAAAPPAGEPQPTPLRSPGEQPSEIVPQASIPQAPPPASTPEAAPPPVSAPVTAPAAPPPASTPEAAAPLATKPPAPPVQAEESSWLSNPVLWIAIALIVLAVGSMVLLPLIRRPARPKPAVRAEGAAAGAPEPAAAPSPARTQVREPLSARREVAASAGPAAAAPASGAVMAAPAAPPRAAEPLSKPAPRPAPKPAGAPPPIDQLLKDIDIGLGQGLPPATGAVPAAGSATRLPDVEPATASVTRAPSAFAPVPSEPPTAPPPRVEPPSAPQPDKLDFDFGDLGFEKAPRPSHLPPLEMKPAAPVPTELPPLELGVPEPQLAVRPASAPAPELKPSIPKVSDLKFEFTDLSQELGRAGAQEDLKLDKALESFSADMLDLGKMEAPAPGGGEAGADYVETKLDLATAYLDMGDQVGARSLLDDVLREGDASQKKRAGELLKSLS